MKRLYILGNWLNGYHEGRFEDEETAWTTLCKRSYLSFPYNRKVLMWVERENEFGYEEKAQCREGFTGEFDINETEAERVKSVCKTAPNYKL